MPFKKVSTMVEELEEQVGNLFAQLDRKREEIAEMQKARQGLFRALGCAVLHGGGSLVITRDILLDFDNDYAIDMREDLPTRHTIVTVHKRESRTLNHHNSPLNVSVTSEDVAGEVLGGRGEAVPPSKNDNL